MSEQDKKELYKQLAIRFTNKQEGTNFTTFEELLKYRNEQDGTNLTEEDLWNGMNEQKLSEEILNLIGGLFYDEEQEK